MYSYMVLVNNLNRGNELIFIKVLEVFRPYPSVLLL